MVMSKQFHSIGGIIIGETSTGSPRVDYLTDALGSVTATVNQTAQVVNTYRYKPFGATLAKTGTGPDPSFGWVGTKGYRPTGNPFSNFYVRRRHADSTAGRWPTQDPIRYAGREWNPYVYVGNSPVAVTDPTGLSADDELCAKWYNSSKWHSCRSQWNQCLHMCGGIGNVDHCCTDSWTSPVTSRECKCINPVTAPGGNNGRSGCLPGCKCGGSGGAKCTCIPHNQPPIQPPINQQPAQPIGLPPARDGRLHCFYKCPAVSPTDSGMPEPANLVCNYICTLIVAKSSGGCPPTYAFQEGYIPLAGGCPGDPNLRYDP